jgi:hypothetical protein
MILVSNLFEAVVRAVRSDVSQVFKSMEYQSNYLQDFKAPFLPSRSTQEQREKVSEAFANYCLNYDQFPEVEEYREKIRVVYRADDALKKIYALNPTFDKKDFEIISNQLEQCSREALTECMVEYMGPQRIESIARAFIDVNAKPDWQDQKWLKICTEQALKDNALQDISNEKRDKFWEVESLFYKNVEELFKNHPEIRNDWVKHVESLEHWNRVSEQLLQIHTVAYRAMLKSPGVEAAFFWKQQLTNTRNM